MSNNYVVYHLHSDYSNAFTIMDSVTKTDMYIKKAQELGMQALGFSEHGTVLGWYNKKNNIEKAGMKYIHAVEIYVTKSLNDNIRDNRHCVLIAKNYDGVKEINKLISNSFNRNDGHYYYNPRISYDELKATSDNIIITTACLGGILNSKDKEWIIDFIKFLTKNKHRTFLEIQHHNIPEQKEYNKLLYAISQKTGIRLIAGTDTHSLNNEYEEGRQILQKAKNIHFEEEENWDLTFKSYDELVEAYRIQNALPKEVYLEAINNTNLLLELCEDFVVDTGLKYPKIYDNPEKVLLEKIKKALATNPYVKRHNKEVILNRLKDELETYKKVGAIDYILLQEYLRSWEKENGIYCGYSRGSVSGSYVAYLLGITEMDSIKFDLNFFRFMNPARVTNADIDTDYSEEDREKVKRFILNDKMNISTLYTSEIITFNTIALKGAIREVGRALNIPLSVVDKISKNIENNEEAYRQQYPELFKYVDLLQGVIVSIGTHPGGVLITDKNIYEEIGVCTLSTTEYPVSMLDMKELEAQKYVKLDILGLDAVGTINETCKLVGINRLTPDNVDLDDINVWRDIVEDSTTIFQWESDSAKAFLKQFMSDETLNKVKDKIKNFSMLSWFSFGNGLIRPACASFRDSVANGEFYDNGIEELNTFLSKTLGHVTMQEDIMRFLVEFCGYSDSESDIVRRNIAKGGDTSKLLPEIEKRFIEYTSQKYNVSKEKCAEVIKPFLQVILDASSYGFSWNHSDSYSCIGYIMGYLRYYYPLEYLCTVINIKKDKREYIAKVIEYANKKGIQIKNIKFGRSKANYFINKEENAIYRGLSQIKHLNEQMANELYVLSQSKQYTNFPELLHDIITKTNVNKKAIEILIKLNYFIDFGRSQKLLDYLKLYNEFYGRKQIKKDGEYLVNIQEIAKYCSKETDKQYSDFDYESFLLDQWNKLEDKTIPLLEFIKAEKEYLGYIQFYHSKLKNMYFVDSFKVYKNKNKPYLTLYNLENGQSIDCRIKDENMFLLKPFNENAIIKIEDLREEYKIKWYTFSDEEKQALNTNKNGEWRTINETEWVLYNWLVLDRGE